MRIRKVTYLVIALLFACTAGMAQSSGFTVSPMAITTGGTSLMSGVTGSTEGGNKCVTNVYGGLRTMEVILNAKGKFGASCEEVAPVASPLITLTSINLFPNPTHTITTLKCEGQFDVNLSCQVRVMSIDGKLMMSKMVAMKDLQAGYRIDASSYAAGTYAVTIEFMNQQYSRKLIKL